MLLVIQGFVSGDPDKDAFAVQSFAAADMEMFVACSFAKNFGLYGERVGALHVVVNDKEHLPAISSQFRSISRTIYSTCPSYGARIVAEILNDATLAAHWREECAAMAMRLKRERLLYILNCI